MRQTAMTESGMRRRDVLRLSAATTIGSMLGPAGAAAGREDERVGSQSALQTPLCALFNIRVPILQAPMPGVVTPEMVAEVGRAGGLGMIGATGMPPDDLRRMIRRVKELTDRPFAVNLILHPHVVAPIAPSAIASSTLGAVQQALNRFRERLGIAAGKTEAPRLPAATAAAFDVILEEKVPVFSAALGKPTPQMLARCRAQGTRVIAMVTTVPDALEMAALDVDAIVAQGGEAGGHRSTWIKRPSIEMATIGLMALLPQIVDAVRVPVVAAGGITGGRQLAAALALGASGVLMGTRFVATRESAAPAFYKQALVERTSDDTTITDAFTGLHARTLRTAFTEDYRASGAPVVPIVQLALAGDITAAAAKQGAAEYYPMYAGQGVGMIDDVPASASVIEAVVAEAERTLSQLARGR